MQWRKRWRSLSSESGSASVTALATIAAMIVVLSGLLLVAGVMGARGMAQTAADLGALAGARVHADGTGDPCVQARAVVEANGGRLQLCGASGADVIVVVGVDVRWKGRPTGLTASASARAGPSP
ncbi:MAG TPA: Rv3654c family TadE-like protein [Actinomycetaceae bacterium]|nr:Rv3654c family TadE-like protein [Actinomycetaceae bacterium]